MGNITGYSSSIPPLPLSWPAASMIVFIEDVPHRHAVFTIPKRLRAFFKYDRKLNSILFRAAWGALSQVLGIHERELAAIFTVQTAGEALNYHPHLHGLLADGYWKEDIFIRFLELDLKVIEEAFAERVLAQLHKQEVITDDDVAQILKAPPPIPKFIDTALAIDELPSYDSFEPSPDDF